MLTEDKNKIYEIIQNSGLDINNFKFLDEEKDWWVVYDLGIKPMFIINLWDLKANRYRYSFTFANGKLSELLPLPSDKKRDLNFIIEEFRKWLQNEIIPLDKNGKIKNKWESHSNGTTSSIIRDVDYDQLLICVRSVGSKYVDIVFRKELIEIINAWQKGEEHVWVNGQKIIFDNPDLFKIYDVKSEFLQKTKPDTKTFINKSLRLFHKSVWSLSALEEFGNDVSHLITVGAYGGLKQVIERKPNEIEIIKSGKKTGNIFISHSTKDSKVVEQFTNQILILSLGMEHSKIFCSSLEGLGIKSGEDFRDRIKHELEEAEIVIQFISAHYKSSEVCLNEMGAAWVLADHVIPIVIDDKYDVGFIHNTTHQLNLNSRTDMLQFIDDWGHLFPKKAKGAKIDGHIDEFLKLIKEIN